MTDVLPEILIDNRGEAMIENFDDLAAAFPKMAQRAVDSALSSEGYRLKAILQRAIENGGPDGHKWEQLSPYYTRLTKGGQSKWRRLTGKTQYRKKQHSARGGARPIHPPLLKLKGGIRYQLHQEHDMLMVGFVNPSTGLSKMLAMHETGFKTPVTRRLQKFFFGLNLPLAKSTKYLESPARPLIGPVFDAEEATISENLERKFFANMDRYWNEES